jgi:hypothetical protein
MGQELVAGAEKLGFWGWSRIAGAPGLKRVVRATKGIQDFYGEGKI